MEMLIEMEIEMWMDLKMHTQMRIEMLMGMCTGMDFVDVDGKGDGVGDVDDRSHCWWWWACARWIVLCCNGCKVKCCDCGKVPSKGNSIMEML